MSRSNRKALLAALAPVALALSFGVGSASADTYDFTLNVSNLASPPYTGPYVAVDVNRKCWVLLDAPVFAADYRDVAPIVIRRTRDGSYEVQMSGLPVESNFNLIPSPDASTWVSVKVV